MVSLSSQMSCESNRSSLSSPVSSPSHSYFSPFGDRVYPRDPRSFPRKWIQTPRLPTQVSSKMGREGGWVLMGSVLEEV